METSEKIGNLKSRMEKNLKECILPFWSENLLDETNGGFYGRVQAGRVPDLQSPKSVVLNCRMLWTFTQSWKILGEEQYKDLARRAYDYVCDNFWDDTYGGVYWMVTCTGNLSEPEKRTYGQAFLIYSMAEYYQVFGDAHALELAMKTLRHLNNHMKYSNGGYADSATRDWLRDDWVNIWVKNKMGAPKLLNSNMHLFEAVLALAKVHPDSYVISSLKEQLVFLLETAVDYDMQHLKAGMKEDGTRLDEEINFGHDCECCYLMIEAAKLLKDAALLEKTQNVVDGIMERVYKEGIDPENGGLYYMADHVNGDLNRSKIWWVQAEGITAFFDSYQRSGEERYLDAAISIWDYVEANMVNYKDGDWYCVGKNRKADETLQMQQNELACVFTNTEMAGKGKCPYHNSRACFEIMKRAEQY